MMRLELKIELIRRYGNQQKAAEALGILNSQVTGLIQGRDPNWNEVPKLLAVFTPLEMRKFFGMPYNKRVPKAEKVTEAVIESR